MPLFFMPICLIIPVLIFHGLDDWLFILSFYCFYSCYAFLHSRPSGWFSLVVVSILSFRQCLITVVGGQEGHQTCKIICLPVVLTCSLLEQLQKERFNWKMPVKKRVVVAAVYIGSPKWECGVMDAPCLLRGGIKSRCDLFVCLCLQLNNGAF